MKVLFAVSNDNQSSLIIKKYSEKYKEIITSKNVYYFNAIIKELQKDKTYDAIVIGEDLEPISNNNYDSIDKFLFDKLDNISDEAYKTTGEDIPIILICSDRRTKSDQLLVKLFGIGIYNALLGNDRNVETVCNLIYKPRSKKEAKSYYKIGSDEVNYEPGNESEVSENEIKNILSHYKKLGNNEKKYVESFDSIASQYNDTQLRIIIKFLPNNVKNVLEKKSEKYQKLVNGGTVLSNGQYKPYSPTNNKPSSKRDILTVDIEKPTIKGQVIIPSTMDITTAQTVAPAVNQNNNRNSNIMNNNYNNQENSNIQPLNSYGETSINSNNNYFSKPTMNMSNSQNIYQPEPMGMQNQSVYQDNTMNNVQPQEVYNPEPVGMQNQSVYQDNTMNNVQPQEVYNPEPVGMQNQNVYQDNTMNNVQPQEVYNPEPMGMQNQSVYQDNTMNNAQPQEVYNPEPMGMQNQSVYQDNTMNNVQPQDMFKVEPMGVSENTTLNNNNESQAPTIQNPVVEPQPRKRGRPRKIVTNEEAVPQQPKRGRGRPRKNTNVIASDLENASTSVETMPQNVLNTTENIPAQNVEIPNANSQNTEIQNGQTSNNDTFNLFDLGNEPTQTSQYETNNVSPNVENNQVNPYDTNTINNTANTLNNNTNNQAGNSNDDFNLFGMADDNTSSTIQEQDPVNGTQQNYINNDLNNSPVNPYDTFNNATNEMNHSEVNNNQPTSPYEVSSMQSNPYDVNTMQSDSYNVNPFQSTSFENEKEQTPYENDANLPYGNELNNENQFNNAQQNYTPEVNNESENQNGFGMAYSQTPQFNNDLFNVGGETQDLTRTRQRNNVIPSNFIAQNKIVAFVGTTKNGTSFIVNNLAELLSQKGIKTAILDLTKNKNSYYMFTDNDQKLMDLARQSISNLARGNAEGVQVNKNLTVFTSVPEEINDDENFESVLQTLDNNFSAVLIDCDFNTDINYFVKATEIYLVQSMDALTIQPLTQFLSELKMKNALDESKLRVVINKEMKLKLVNNKMILGGMAKYNEPSMTLQRDLFDPNNIKYTTIPFEMQTYARYLEAIALCQVSLNGYSQEFLNSLEKLASMVYPLLPGSSNYNNYSPNYEKAEKRGLFRGKSKKQSKTQFSSGVNGTLNKMRANY